MRDEWDERTSSNTDHFISASVDLSPMGWNIRDGHTCKPWQRIEALNLFPEQPEHKQASYCKGEAAEDVQHKREDWESACAVALLWHLLSVEAGGSSRVQVKMDGELTRGSLDSLDMEAGRDCEGHAASVTMTCQNPSAMLRLHSRVVVSLFHASYHLQWIPL